MLLLPLILAPGMVNAKKLKVKVEFQPFGPGEFCSSPVSVDGNFAAGSIYEYGTSPDILFYYDFQKKQQHVTDINDAYSPSIRGQQIAFLQPLGNRNHTVSVYSIATGTVTPTDIKTAGSVNQEYHRYFDGQHIVFVDNLDKNVKVYSLSDGSTIDTGLTGKFPTVDGDYVTFETSVYSDHKIVMYRISTGQSLIIDSAGSPIVRGNFIVYNDWYANEIKYYQIDTGQIFSTGIVDSYKFSTDGQRIVFEVRGEAITTFDLVSGKMDSTGVYGCSGGDSCWLDISGKYITYERYEGGTEIQIGSNWVEIYPPQALYGDNNGDCVAGWFTN
jgi:hypothetical protein